MVGLNNKYVLLMVILFNCMVFLLANCLNCFIRRRLKVMETFSLFIYMAPNVKHRLNIFLETKQRSFLAEIFSYDIHESRHNVDDLQQNWIYPKVNDTRL